MSNTVVDTVGDSSGGNIASSFEHRVLRKMDVDAHGIVSITRAWDRRSRSVKSTKSKHTRRFSAEPNLLPLLREIADELDDDSEALLAELPSERATWRGAFAAG